MAYARNSEDRDAPGFKESTNKPTYDRVKKRPLNVGSNSSSSNGSFFGWILVVLIAFNIPRFLMGSGFNFSFQELLTTLINAPAIDITWVTNTIQSITADWGVLNFIRDFVNLLIDFFRTLAFWGTGVVQIITYLIYFLGKLFGF